MMLMQKDIPILLLELDKDMLGDVIGQLIEMEYIKSKSEFYQLVKQGEVQVNNERIAEDDLSQVLYNCDILRIGKTKFARINK